MVNNTTENNTNNETYSNDTVMECKNITHFYGHVQALNNVNLKLRKKEMLGLVGDNGAGKSTLVKILRGVQKPTEGEIFIEGERRIFNSPRNAVRHGIQCVYQEQAIVEQLSVAENFFLGQEPIRGNKRSVVKLVDYNKMIEESSRFLAKMGFDLHVGEEISKFSGGERQAVSILRALFFNPKILLLDEPTTALSEKAKVRLFELLQETVQVCPVILITHDIYDAIRICNRLVVLKHGSIVYEYKIEEHLSEEETFRELLQRF
jgi:simple sugar transport system ATP-binding protein